MEREHFRVNGIANNTMKVQMKKALRKIEGVNDVCIDKGRSTIEVMYNPPATSEAIWECIEGAGQR